MTRSRVSLHESQPSSPRSSDGDESEDSQSGEQDRPRTRGRKEHRRDEESTEA